MPGAHDGEPVEAGFLDGISVPEIRREAIEMDVLDPKTGAVSRVILREATVIADDWIDPSDTDRNRRKAKRVSGFRAADPLLAMHQRGGTVTKHHLAAAARLRTCYEIGVLGGAPGRGGFVRLSGGGGGVTQAFPAEQQLMRLRDYRAAMAAVGVRCMPLIGHVVLGLPEPERRDVKSYADRHGLDEKFVRGQLVAGLDRLVDHFNPPDAGRVDAAIDALA